MQPILANYTASITELKKSPTQLLKDAGDEAIAILNHNVASAYLVPASLYEKMMEVMDDYYLSKEVEERLKDNEKPIRVELDELLSWFSSNEVKDLEIIVYVVSVGKRENNKVYENLKDRIWYI